MTDDTLSLIEKSQKGDRQAAEMLIIQNSGLVWTVAKRYFHFGVDPDDLYQLGCLGFMKAVAGFDLSYGTQFSTYAVPKIAGEIRRFLRDDGTVKVSRSLKERAATIKKEQDRLSKLLGREPTVSELSEALSLTPEQIAAAETATAQIESIQQPNGENACTLESTLADGWSEEAMVDEICLHEAISHLPEREKLVIQLRYFHALTQEKTARLMGVSQVQISRLEKKAIERLRDEFLSRQTEENVIK